MLSGKTLQVYWYMLRHRGALNLRDIQRGAGISSASLAAYHLRKLQGLGLVEVTRDGEYAIRREVQVGVTRFYVNIKRTMIPRFAFYASFYLAMIVLCMLLLQGAPTYLIVLLVAVALFGLLTSILETVILSRITPS
jgi:DNA-binding MarR family transcriptional regulator